MCIKNPVGKKASHTTREKSIRKEKKEGKEGGKIKDDVIIDFVLRGSVGSSRNIGDSNMCSLSCL